MTENLLARETSPYLLQHRDNPVHWRPWGAAVLDEARRHDKPILLSVGYAACHWCHVMAHESFETQEIADVMNDLFVNVKVDREERPDVDTIYQSALAMMGQQGGWPLTMFLTPDGHPFWGGTYFPATPRYGRPGFPDVLKAVARAYREDRDKIATNVSALRDGLAKLASPPAGRGLSMAIVDSVASTAMRIIDPLEGGTAGAPKFPQPVFFRFLWRAFLRTGAPMLGNAVTTTATALCQGGIYDHVGGGFARYATDEIWLVPHFEKMLYDNALLVDLLTELWRHDQNPLWERRIRETIDWALRDLRVDGPNGTFAFASAFDADSEGVEGKFYVWTEAEIDGLLGADAPLFKAVYDVTPGGNWEDHTILNRRAYRGLRSDDEEATLRRSLATLATARSRRVPPQRDDKVLADWNGLIIKALAHAAVVFDEDPWRDAARRCFDFVTTQMDSAGRLRHSWCNGSAQHPAVLDDYANMILAALALFEASGDAACLARAEAWAEVVHAHYVDASDGGYFLSADDTLDVIVRTKTVADHATPSGNAMMVEGLARLWHITGDPRYRDRADTLIQLFSGDNPQYLVGVPGLLTAYEVLERARQVVIVGDRDDPATRALRHAAVTAGTALTLVISVDGDSAALPETHPAAGKTTIAGMPAAYVCANQTCSPPATDVAALAALLTTPRG